ncbi:MAG TPA: T9SS type A sorting domain-containing protein, partial [Candidatus Marinimicrobia bacterium]|nr:T9SS type A sorting domain-containing protein [Candidatus Neomarinimicrobiota bacterium]
LTYDALFQVTKAPARPDVKVTELDEEIIMEWSSNLTRVNDVENTVSEPGSYAFEGYNVYQMPRGNSTISDAKRIVTYDLASDPTVILDEGFDATSGQILLKPVQFGSNAGVKRFFVFDRDHVKDVDKLNNGQEYYVAVTAYSAASQEGYIPASLESSPEIITVVPQKPFGTVYNTSYGDTLEVEQVAGQSDGVIVPIVVDPGASTGAAYELSFTDSEGGSVANLFNLTNKTSNSVVLADQTNFSGDSDYALADGVFLVVSGPALEGKDWDYTGGSGTGVRWISGAGGGELLYGGAYLGPNFTGSNVPPANYETVEFRLANVLEGTTGPGEDYTVDTSHPNASKAATYATWGAGNFTGIIDVPFSAYTASGRQLNIVVRDYDGNGAWDMHYEGDDEGENARPYNYTWILDSDYDEAASWDGDTDAEDFMAQVDIDGGPVLWALWLKDRGGRPFFSDDGTLTLIPNLVITTNDIYSFTSPAPTTGLGEEEYSAKRVNVFPNPYYAFNPAEVTRMARFVTFNNLSPKATIRIFNLGGQLVTKLNKDDETQFLQWDLLNFQNIPVASGMYIAHVEMVMPSGGEVTKMLKLAIIQEKEMLDIY